MSNYQLITILGPTASGKTALATSLAYELKTEIISADSRQVYRGMNIGTGKDLSEYIIHNTPIPYHLIDICEAGEKYNIFEYQHDFNSVYSSVTEKGLVPILCGGSGLYIESVLKGYKLPAVPENKELRQRLIGLKTPELLQILAGYDILNNSSESNPDSAKRIIRAIEIAEYSQCNTLEYNEHLPLKSLIFGISPDRETRRQRITQRLKIRLSEGMIEEIKQLLDSGISANDLIYYGLEYKFITLYLTGALNYQEMFNQLETAIHQFAKRQMTWFRRMEKQGFNIHWLSSEWTMEEKLHHIRVLLDK